MKSKLFASLALAFCCVTYGSAASLILSDFENEQDLSRFTRRSGIQSFTLTSEHRTHGDRAARLVFAEWKEGAEQWPAIILAMKNGLPSDWSSFDAISLSVRNESRSDADVAIHIADTQGQTTSHHFTVSPGKTQTLSFPLDPARVNISSVREVHVFSTRPPEQLTLVLDHLRLEEDTDDRLAEVERQLRELKPQCDALRITRHFEDVYASFTALRDRARSTSGVEARRELRSDIGILEDRVRLRLPRAISEARMRKQFRAINGDASYACGFASSMEKVFPKDVPFDAKVSRTAEIELAGNETESFQLLVLAGDQELKSVRVTADRLTRADGLAATVVPDVRVSPVGFVETKKPPYTVKYVGWHPDPILDFLSAVDIKAGELQPFWIRVHAPARTPAGEYRGTIVVSPENASSIKFGIRVKVWDFDVPEERHLRTALSLRDQPIGIVYGGLTRKMWQSYCDFILSYRLNPDNIYALRPPSIDDLIRWNSMGLNAFNVIYAMKPADLQPGAPYPEERKQAIMAQLDTFIPKLKEHGLYEKAYLYGFDEVRPESFTAMKDIFATIKARYPDLLTMTTAYDPTYGEATGLSEIDAWVPLTRAYDPVRAQKVREKGKQVWWYICIEPKAPFANWLIEYDAIDARSLMGLQTAKYRPDGFLYYAINRWPLSKKPITDGPYTDWPPASFGQCNGDGSFICAGPDGPLATIRLENIRDGLEDYEYFWVLGQEIERLKKIPGPDAWNARRQAEKAYRISDDLVRSLQDFSKDPAAIYAKRRQVAEAIVRARSIAEQK